MSAPIVLERNGPVARITLVAPERGNAIDQSFADLLLEVVHSCGNDPAIRAVLILGSGRFFCVGGDVRAFAGAVDNLGSFVQKLTASLHVAIARLAALAKPVVVAVNGPAAGAGLGLAIAGDVVIAARSATFTLAYSAIGLSPDAGTTFMLPRLIGLRRAQEMLYLRRSYTATEAADIGLITRVVADEDLTAQAEEVVNSLARMPTRALGRSKRLLLSSSTQELEAQLEREAAAIARCALEPHASEGIGAFLEGRKARFE